MTLRESEAEGHVLSARYGIRSGRLNIQMPAAHEGRP